VTDLTTVELLWLEKRIENRIRFGRAVAEQIIDRRRRILSFAPGTVFAFVRWASNDFGTIISRVDILRAATPGQRYSTVPWVKPGGDILLRLTGWPKVERVLQLIDAVEALDIHPADVALDYWHHVHNRLSVNETPRPYTRARHQAWLRRQDSVTCRGCHDANAINPKSEDGRTSHAMLKQGGVTCVDCHVNLVHPPAQQARD